MSGANTATVVTLTAEVKTLVVGSRQITLSVAKQLDWADYREIEPMGRIHLPGPISTCEVEVIGRHKETGALVTSCIAMDLDNVDKYRNKLYSEATKLPLIVLAGLR